MPLDFLTPRVERLRADGAFEILHEGGVLGRLRRPVVLLARELTSFNLFETAQLPASRRRQAARLHARTASPYVVGHAALVNTGADFGVWWWDLERVSPLIEGRFGAQAPAIRPETLAQPAGREWRIVKLSHGYEAQLWREGGLVASAWRRERYDVAAWRAFARVQRGFDAAPDQAPPAETLPIDFGGEAFSLARAEITREQAMGMAAAGFAMAMCCAALFLAGQGLGLKDGADEIESEVAEIRAATPGAGALAGLDADRRRLAAFREIEERTSPLSAAGAAIGVVALADLSPTGVEAEGDTLRVILPYTAIRQADALIAEFEASGYFYDVRPRTDGTNSRLVMEMRVREAAPALTAGG